MPSVATGSDDKITLRVVSWNAASVLPESPSQYTAKLSDTVKLLPWVPDLILLQETRHIKKDRAGVVNREQTERKIQSIAPLLGDAYEFHAARVFGQSTQDATHCLGTGLFIRKESVLYGRGRFWQPSWDEDADGHVCGWEVPEGLIVGAYMPTPTAKSRSGGPAQSAVRAKYDVNLRNELVERQADVLCVLGDFNVTLQAERDCPGPLWSGCAYVQTRARFREMLTATSLVDAFRARRPMEKRYTSFQQRTSGSQALFQARVDLCLLPQRRMAELVDVDILDEDGKFTKDAYKTALRSDHVPLVAVLRLQRCRTPPPPPDKRETGARGAGGRGGGGRGERAVLCD